MNYCVWFDVCIVDIYVGVGVGFGMVFVVCGFIIDVFVGWNDVRDFVLCDL